jgi:hypothetical protein
MATSENKTYIGSYKVMKLFRVSGRRKTIAKDLTREQAINLVNKYPDSRRSMVIFEKQYYSEKYFI